MKLKFNIILLLIAMVALSIKGFGQISASPRTTTTCPGQTMTFKVGISAGFGSGISADDDFSQVINIGFPFNYFGTNYTQCVISDNGFLTFDLTKALGYSSFVYATALGSGDLDRAIMYPFQDLLLNAATMNNMSTISFGVPGSRVFVLQTCQVRFFSCTNMVSSSQIVLYEGTNIIDINIINKPAGCNWQNGTGVVGIRNAPAEILVPGKNLPNVNWADQNKTYRYTPTGTGTYTLDSIPYTPQAVIAFPDKDRLFWYAQGDTINPIGLGDSINVIADKDINYYVVKYNGDGLCYSTDTVNFYDTVFVNFNNYRGTTNASICAGSTYQFYEQLVFQTGRYYKNLISYQGCDSVLELFLTVNPLPDATLNVNGTIEICDGLSKKVGLVNKRAAETVQWFRNGLAMNGSTDQELEIFESGDYHVVVTNENGCVKESDRVTAIVRPTPKAEILNIAYGEVLCTYDTVLIVAANEQGNEYYWWPETALRSYNTNLYGSTVVGIFRELNTPMSLTVKNIYNCVATTDFVVKTKPCCDVYFPNAFTPNGDGVNDKFVPALKPNQNIILFSVYDRIGNLVYEATSNTEGWDGTYKNGKDAGAGVYMYHCIYTCDDGQNYTKKEAVTLLR